MADITQNEAAQENKKFGPFAYLKDAIKIIHNNKSYRIELKYNGKTKALKTKLLLITMTDTIGGRQALSLDAKVGDGLIRVYSLKEINLLKILFHLNKLRKGQLRFFVKLLILTQIT